MLGRAVGEHALAQQFDHMSAVQPPRHADRQTFSRKFVDHHQQPQTAAIVGARLHEVIAPQMIRMFRAQPDAAPIVEPQPSPRPVLGGNFQPFATPDALHPILAHTPARLLEKCRDAPVTEASVLTRQRDDRLGQPVFVAALRGPIPLGPARLFYQPARMPFTQSFFPSVVNGNPAPLGT